MEKNDAMAWKVLDSEYVFKRPWLTARKDHVQLPTGAEINEYYVLEYPDFCTMIALTTEGQWVMERQYRHGCQLTALELPCGCVEPGEDPMAAAQRELYEETGFGGGQWQRLMTVNPNPGACNNAAHCFLALGVERISTQHLEASEDIQVVLLDEAEVRQLLENDEIHQSIMQAVMWKYFCLHGKEK